MGEAVYLLCALTSVSCALLLLRAYRKSQSALLLWSSLCFGMFALNNVLRVVDRLVVSNVDLLIMRTSVMLTGFVLLLYGLIWEKV